MKTVLIGLGMVSGTHLAALEDLADRITLHGIMGRDPAKAQDFAATASERLGHEVKIFTSIDEIATDPNVDFVIIATPPDARVAFVERLAAAGKPLLLEKPIERSFSAAKALVEVYEAADLPMGIVFQHRTRHASGVLKKAIDDGLLGDIATVDIRVPWWRPQSYYDEPGRGSYARDGGGVMINQAIHTLDVALWLAGPVARLQAMMRQTPVHNLEAEDWAAALLEFKSGAIGSLTATTAAFPGTPESISIQGTRGHAILQRGQVTIDPFEGDRVHAGEAQATGGGADPMAFTHAWHRQVIEDFAEALQQGRRPLATGREALEAQAVIDAMERASRSATFVDVSE